ncbi:tRNA lysidine(34) synthetase TilS [Mucilaginibacter galii]|uniref:tRNA(Ile)-lysidine synthase n=1 Tax=Mucilaginibacter galii TaxID=2005073 RepID=A0A917J999_9SPHI|nr:tRNA lysidine(34) synthetase TilS [Mucilaginibacter galii]GGI49796.1 tRNA(Ile)-lysidine synthase [Mucilaginibacter galii]
MLPVERFTAFIKQNQLFTPQEQVLAAVSGGMDSVLMVHLLKAAGYNFAIAHCNFQLRSTEAIADQEFCRQLAQQLQVPFYTTDFDTAGFAREQKVSIQMAARELRYRWFKQLSQQHQYTAVALAHHQNDTIETILLNLTRGTGIAGLHGILSKNNLWVRPLMFITRAEIEGLIVQHQLAYVEDSSNASTKYARNKLRHEVVPKLKELNPNLEQTFERNLHHFRELELLLQQQLAMVKKDLWVVQDNEVHLPLAGLRNLYPQRLLLVGLLKEYGFNETSIDGLIASLNKHSGRVFESLTHTLLLDRDKLILKPKAPNSPEPVQIYETDELVNFGNHKLKIVPTNELNHAYANANQAITDAGLLIYPLMLRTWQQGDYFVPLGMNTRKKLSDFFINQKIQLHQKTQIPLLVNGNGEVIWIAGYRLSNRYKLTPQTKKVTIFELLKP